MERLLTVDGKNGIFRGTTKEGYYLVGNGADAPKWFQAGLVQKVANYCSDDVAIERDLAEFVDRYGYVVHNGKQLFLKG